MVDSMRFSTDTAWSGELPWLARLKWCLIMHEQITVVTVHKQSAVLNVGESRERVRQQARGRKMSCFLIFFVL